MVWFQASVVAIQSFVSGFATSSLNSCLKEKAKGSILNDLAMTSTEQQIATAITTGAALVASLLMSYPVKWFGYRPNVLFGAVITIFAGTLMGFSHLGFGYLVAGRALLGWGVGLNSMTAPVLLSEVASPSSRGKVTALHQLMITIGIFTAGALAYGFVENMEHGWRYILVFPAALGILNIILAFVLPESPVWLVRSDKEELARKTLLRLRTGDETHEKSVEAIVEGEIDAIKAEIEAEQSLAPASWGDVFTSGRIFWIGLGLQFFQPLSGINAIMFYSTKIFGFAGVKQDIVATMLVAALNVVMTIVCMYTIELAGRKSLLFSGTAVCAVSLGVLGAVLLLLNDNPSAQGYIAVVLVMLYVAGFAIGLGAVGWVIMAEVTPARIRAKSYSLFISENWTLNLFIALFSLSVIEALGGGSSDDQQKKGVAYLFLIFCGFCVLTCLFVWRLIPETKGLSNEQIAALMKGDKAVEADQNEAIEDLSVRTISINSQSGSENFTRDSVDRTPSPRDGYSSTLLV